MTVNANAYTQALSVNLCVDGMPMLRTYARPGWYVRELIEYGLWLDRKRQAALQLALEAKWLR